MGKHVILAGYINGPKAAKSLFVFEILFPASNTACKVSTLLLYKRIFGATRNRLFAAAVYILIFLWTLLFVIGTCCTIFQCAGHLSYAWETDHLHGCLNLSEMIFALTTVSVVLNVFTLILPIPLIHRLQLPPKTKFGVLLVFILGSGDMAISIIRAVETSGNDLTNLDFTWLQSRMVMLGFSEPCLGIVCTCIILLRPIFAKFTGAMTRTFSGLGSRLGPRFALSTNTESSGQVSERKGYFVVPIFLQTKASSGWSSFKDSMKSGMSGATLAFSRKDDLDDLDEWERRPGKDKGPAVQEEEMNVLTHPWKMDTFEKLKEKEEKPKQDTFDKMRASSIQSGTSSMNYDTIETVKRLQILKLDKPLPSIPDDISSINDNDRHERRSFS